MDTRVTRLAERQHGIVGRRQLLAAGVHVDQVDVLLRRAHVARVSRGVYRVAGAPETPQGELLAAALRCGPEAVVVGERVLALLRTTNADPAGPFTVLTRPQRVVTGVEWRWRTNPLPTLHRAVVDGIPSTTPARNMLEVAVDGSREQMERLADGCRWNGSITAVEELCRAHPGHPGAARLLDSGLIGEGAAESPPERHDLQFLVEMGARRQAWVTPRLRVDFVFEEARLVVEYHGGLHFGPQRNEYDKGRELAIRSLGYGLVTLAKEDLRDLAAARQRIELVLGALGG